MKQFEKKIIGILRLGTLPSAVAFSFAAIFILSAGNAIYSLPKRQKTTG